MAKSNKDRPKLIEDESVDPRTKIKVKTWTRGILHEEIITIRDRREPFPIDFSGLIQLKKTIRQGLEDDREAIRAKLEAKQIPCGRISRYVSINGSDFLPLMNGETIQSLPKHSKICSWSVLAANKTERLSLDRAYVDYLVHLERILERFENNEDLSLIDAFVEAAHRRKLFETNIFDLASEKLNIDKITKEAGKKSAEVRRAMSKEKWRNTVLKLAIDLREKAPELSQSSLASKITDIWKDDIELLPSHDRLVIFIRESEKSGALPPRKKGGVKGFRS